MIIFKDKITDDEMISDSYDLKEIDGIAYEADCAMIEEGVGEIGKSDLRCSYASIGEVDHCVELFANERRGFDQTLVATPLPRTLPRTSRIRRSRSTMSSPRSVWRAPSSTRRAT